MEEFKDGDFIDNSGVVRITLVPEMGYSLYKLEKVLGVFGGEYMIVNQYTTTCKYKNINEEFADMRLNTGIW